MQTGYTKLPRDIVEVSGPDRDVFLQGLISQDVARVTPEHAAYGALLTPQGKYLHDFCLAEVGDALWLDCEGSRGADLVKRLSIFRLRSKVSIALREDLGVLSVFGKGAAAALGLPDTAGAAASGEDEVRFVDPRTARLGCRWICRPDEVERRLVAAGIGESAFAAYDRLRISLGVPDGTRDMEPEKSILLECNFEALNGVDWEKGCYMGQELTARTKYRGLVKRRLVPLSVTGEMPAPGTVIEADARTVGELRSVCGDIALASVRVDALQQNAGTLIGTANGANLRILPV